MFRFGKIGEILAARGALIMAAVACCAELHAQAGNKAAFRPEIPKTWDEAAISTLEIPLANPAASPKHVSSDYYYTIPIRPIYKSYAFLPPAASGRLYGVA